MIVIKLIGGLGNQIFQYAAARSLAKRKNTRVAIDLTRLTETPNGETIRKYALHFFDLDVEILDKEQISQIENANIPTFYNSIKSKLGLNCNKYHYYTELRFYNFEDTFYDLPINTYLLNSYFQNLDYISPIEDLLRKELKLINAYSKNEITVGVHVRRSDYVNLPSAAGFHGTCGVEYYKKAIELLSTMLNTSAHFIFFSDEPNWVKENILLPANHSFAANTTDFEDFSQLSQCSNQIIANSSFSWWAAWLNPNPKKIVVAPAKWVKDDEVDTSGLFPSNWILL